MNDPFEQFSKYQANITKEIRYLDQNMKSLKQILNDFRGPDEKEFAEKFEYLFREIYGLLYDNIILTLSWLFEHEGQRSLVWYLTRLLEILSAKNNDFARGLADKQIGYEPTRFYSERSIEVYKQQKELNPITEKQKRERRKELINKWKNDTSALIKEIESKSGEYERIKHIRDKAVAHRDPKVFDDPDGFWEEVDNIEDLETLADLAVRILQHHYEIFEDAEYVLLESGPISISSLFFKLQEYMRIIDSDFGLK